MICSNCGKQGSDTAKVCGFCGQRLQTSDPPPAPPAQEPTSPPELSSQPPQPANEPSEQIPRQAAAPPPSPIPDPLPAATPVSPVQAAAVAVSTPKTRQPLPKWAWWLIGLPLAIGVNYLFGYLYDQGFPIVLDMLGTVVITVLLGPIAGMIAGVGLTLLATETYYSAGYYFIPVHLIFALGAWLTHRLGWFRNAVLAVLGGLVTNLIASMMGALIIVLAFLTPIKPTFARWWGFLQGSITNPLNLQLPAMFLLIWLVCWLRQRRK